MGINKGVLIGAYEEKNGGGELGDVRKNASRESEGNWWNKMK